MQENAQNQLQEKEQFDLNPEAINLVRSPREFLLVTKVCTLFRRFPSTCLAAPDVNKVPRQNPLLVGFDVLFLD